MPEMKTLTVGGVTFRIADADAVKYVPQTPTAPEQEQAQKNINVKNLTVLVSDIEGGHRLVFIDVNGSHVVDLMDGKDGFSPTAKVERTETGVRISITDKEGTTIAEVKDSQNGEGGTVDLTGYATEQWVKDGYQPKGNYALASAIPTKVSQLENDAKYLKEADKAGLINEVIAALPVYNGEVIT